MLFTILDGKSVHADAIQAKLKDGQEYNGDFKSPYNGSKHIFVRQSNRARAFFRHESNPPELVAKYGKGGESEEHRVGKTFVSDLILEKRPNTIVVDEHQKWFNGERIADVAEFRNGFDKPPTAIHEIQLSAIPMQEIFDRTKFYIQHGVEEIFWWFDREHDWWQNSEAQQGIINAGGVIGTLRFKVDYVPYEI